MEDPSSSSSSASALPSSMSPPSRSTGKVSVPLIVPDVPLTRTGTDHSFHAQSSLRHIATHETGELICRETDRPEDERVDTREGRDLEHGHESRDLSDHSHPSNVRHGGSDEEENVALEKSGGGRKNRWKKKDEPLLQDQTNLLPTRQVILVFIGLCVALFCSLLDQTIVTTALPTLGRVFNRSDIAPWVGTAYLLTSTALQPIYSRISDIFGRKFVLLASLVIFLIGSLACALARSMIQLIIFRAIQGIGGGGILTLSMIIVSDVVSLKERGKYQGIIGCVVATANSLGPIVGGLFTERVTWRWCFYINLPLTGLAIVVIIFLLPLRRVKGSMAEKLKKVDWYGSVLTLAWAILVLLAISWAGGQFAWSSAAVLAPLFIGLALLGVFLFVEARLVPLPLIPMRIFNSTTVSAGMVLSMFSGIAFYSTLYYLPTYFQTVRGVSAIRSGVLLLPLVTVQTVTVFTTGMLTSKTGDYHWNLAIGFGIWTIGLGLLSTIDENTSLAKLIGYQVIDGIGAGQTFQTSLIAIQASVSRSDMATATGIRNFLRMLGGTLALTFCSTIVNNLVRNRLNVAGLSRENIDAILSDPSIARDGQLGLDAAQQLMVVKAYARGIQACFWFMIPFAGISLVLTVLFIKKIPLKRDDDAAKKAEAKAWLESKKAKHAHGHGHSVYGKGKSEELIPVENLDGGDDVSRSRQESLKTVTGDGRGEGSKPKVEGVIGNVEKEFEDAGRGIEEAVGVQPSAKEGLDQGPIGSKA